MWHLAREGKHLMHSAPLSAPRHIGTIDGICGSFELGSSKVLGLLVVENQQRLLLLGCIWYMFQLFTTKQKWWGGAHHTDPLLWFFQVTGDITHGKQVLLNCILSHAWVFFLELRRLRHDPISFASGELSRVLATSFCPGWLYRLQSFWLVTLFFLPWQHFVPLDLVWSMPVLAVDGLCAVSSMHVLVVRLFAVTTSPVKS